MNEKILEFVEEQLQQDLEEQVAKVRRAAVVKVPDDFDGSCTECGEDIPKGRLKTGAITCIECQNRKENRSKHSKRLLIVDGNDS